LSDLVALVDQDLRNTCKAISELASPDQIYGASKTIDELTVEERAILETLFQNLAVHLRASDLEAMDALEALQNHIRTCSLQIEFQPLEDCIEEYDFENALKHLTHLFETLHFEIE
jgi:hypothetical protein